MIDDTAPALLPLPEDDGVLIRRADLPRYLPIAAQTAASFAQQHLSAHPCRRNRSHNACSAATHDQNVRFIFDRNLFLIKHQTILVS